MGLCLFTGLGFEAYLWKTAEEIIDHALHMVIGDVERSIFEEETSIVTVNESSDCVNELMGEALFVDVTVNV
jgi:hypothetical protein